MTIEENKTLVKKFIDANEKSDSSALDGLSTSDFVAHAMAGNPPFDITREQVKQLWENTPLTFSDLKLTIEDMIAEGDKVSVRTTLSGNHIGKFFNIESTGKSVTVAQFTIYRIQEGKIAEMWNLVNLAGELVQMGVIPPIEELGK